MQDNPFTNPSDENYRLKRIEKQDYGFNLHTLIFEGLIPAFFGAMLISLAYLVFPALEKCMQHGTMRFFSNNLAVEYASKVAPILRFDFSNPTVLWTMLFGAILGITVKYFYSNQRPK